MAGKAGENGQNSGEHAQPARPLVPVCGDTSKTFASYQIGREDGSGVAIDWVTRRSYSHEGDGSLSGLRKGCTHCGKESASVRA